MKRHRRNLPKPPPTHHFISLASKVKKQADEEQNISSKSTTSTNKKQLAISVNVPVYAKFEILNIRLVSHDVTDDGNQRWPKIRAYSAFKTFAHPCAKQHSL